MCLFVGYSIKKKKSLFLFGMYCAVELWVLFGVVYYLRDEIMRLQTAKMFKYAVVSVGSASGRISRMNAK